MQFNPNGSAPTLRKIREIVTTDLVDSVYISTDENGNSFSLKELYVEIVSVINGALASDQAGVIALNTGSTTSYFNTANKLSDITALLRKTNEGQFLIRAEYVNGHWNVTYHSRNTVNISPQTVFGTYNPTITQPCTNINIGDASSPNAFQFGIGTKITVWGVNA